MAKTLVTFARNRIAYTVVKSLSQKGIEVIASDCVPYAMTFYSRYYNSKFVYPNPKESENDFISSLLNFCQKQEVKVIIACHEEGFVLSKHKEKFLEKGIAVPLPDYEKTQKAHNKKEAIYLVETLGISIPKTYEIRSLEDLNSVDKFPVVIKLIKGRGGVGFKKVYDKTSLVRDYKKLMEEFGIKELKDYPVVQEFIEGYGVGVSMLFDNGKAVASFTHRRTLEIPPEGGFSIERKSYHHQEAEEKAKQILENLGWHGVAMVEFRIEERTNKPYFLEINPRLWGSLYQAVAAGVDFPYLIHQMAAKQPFEQVFEYKLGVKTRWLAGMLAAFPAYLKSKLRWKYFKSLISFFEKNSSYDDFHLSDPLPFLMEFVMPLVDLFKGKSPRATEIQEVKNEYS